MGFEVKFMGFGILVIGISGLVFGVGKLGFGIFEFDNLSLGFWVQNLEFEDCSLEY